jgi:hypothetical protein
MGKPTPALVDLRNRLEGVLGIEETCWQSVGE